MFGKYPMGSSVMSGVPEGTQATPLPVGKYWLGITTDWMDSVNWALVDGGIDGVGGRGVPLVTDDVYFTSSYNGNCTIVGNIFCQALVIQDGYVGTFDMATYDLYVAGNVSLLCTGGTVDFGSGSWLIDGDLDIADCGTLTYGDVTAIEMTGAASSTTYIHGGDLKNLIIQTGANIEQGSNGTSSTWYGILDVYGTLTLTQRDVTMGSGSTTNIYDGGVVTGSIYSLSIDTASITCNGIYSCPDLTLRHDCSISGIFSGDGTLSVGNKSVDSVTRTIIFGSDVVWGGDFIVEHDQAASTLVLDLDTNSSDLYFRADVDFATYMTAGTLNINNANGRFIFLWKSTQNINSGGKDIGDVVLYKTVNDITFDNTIANISGTTFGEVIIK